MGKMITRMTISRSDTVNATTMGTAGITASATVSTAGAILQVGGQAGMIVEALVAVGGVGFLLAI